ncbi:MAG: hypothetical protein PPP58_03070 [Natronomonas sp.]
METVSSGDMGIGLALAFGILGVLGAIGMTAFGFTGDQVAAGWSFALAMLGGTLAVAAYHAYG